jgi:dephospho-CoA kinase
MHKLVAVVGMCGSGKSIASEYFENVGYKKIYLGGITMDKLKEENLEVNPSNEKMMRERLRKEYGMGAYALLSIPKIEEFLKTDNVVLDGLYSWDEFVILHEKYPNIKLISIVNNKRLRYNRLAVREVRPLTSEEASNRDISEIENLAKGGPIAFADYFILNNGDMDSYIKDLDSIRCEIEEVD